MASTVVELEGHLIDSLILPRVWGAIEDADAHFHVQEMRVGQSELEESYIRMEVIADDQRQLDELMGEPSRLGAVPRAEHDARLEPAPQDGVLPDDFYSTMSLPTFVRVRGKWVEVAQIEMDVAIVVDAPRGLRKTNW